MADALDTERMDETQLVTRLADAPVLTPNKVDPNDLNSFLITNNYIIDDISGSNSLGQEWSSSEGAICYYNEDAKVMTYIDASKGQITVYDENTRLLTLYTSDPETSGYSINTMAMKMGYSAENNRLENPVLGVSLDVDPNALKEYFETSGTNTIATGVNYDPVSTATFADTFGDVGLSSSSKVYINPSDKDEGTYNSDFRKYFSDYVELKGPFGDYNVEEINTFGELYELEQKFEVFETLSSNFTSTCNALNIDGEFSGLESTYNGLLEKYNNVFTVGNLNFATAIAPIMEQLKIAQNEIENYLEEITSEYAAVAAEKRRILEELARLEKKSSESDGEGKGGNGGR